MVRSVRRWLVAAAFVAAGWASPAAFAQPVPPPPAPVDQAEQPPAYVLPPPGPIVVPELPRPDPLLDRPEAEQPGPYLDVETQLLAVRLRNQPVIPVAAPGGNGALTDLVRFPTNHLDDTISPRIDLGWRLEDGWGGLQFGFRSLSTRGSNEFALGQDPANVSGRFDFEVVDFSYVSREFSLGPEWDMRWGVGPRMAFLYFDSRLAIARAAPMSGDVLAEFETNHFRGYGAFGNLELGRHLSVPGLTAYGKVEFANLYARLKQTGAEVLAGDAGPKGSAVRNDVGLSVPTFNGQVGLSYEPPGWCHSRFLLGYTYETWWQVGRLGLSRGQLDDMGLILRAEINF
jgi:hypothetical protein